MTSVNNIDNVIMILYMLGFGGLFMGVFYLSHKVVLTSVGYITTNICHLY